MLIKYHRMVESARVCVCVYVCVARQEVGRAIFMHVCLAETPVWGVEKGRRTRGGREAALFHGVETSHKYFSFSDPPGRRYLQ